jgi:hypothetical protein
MSVGDDLLVNLFAACVTDVSLETGIGGKRSTVNDVRFNQYPRAMADYALVEASTEDTALAGGKAVFDRLVGAGPDNAAIFDYYVTFDDERSSVAGKARCGELPVVAPVDSDEGTDLLERGWEATSQEFKRNLERVRTAINEFSTDELMHDKDLARHACYNLGAYRGQSLYLYTEFGDAIRNREHLDHVLDADEQV